MIEPLDSLAFSLASQKGVYALLLGSGISRSAGIPTGWEVTLDLVEKLAATQGEGKECSARGSEQWYRDKFDKEPDYSELLEELAKTQSERMQLLRSYFEPTEEERDKGLKQPTQAHKAIANLVKGGYVRVILTTNFDKLMEQALGAVGIDPIIISSNDGLNGALPIVHSSCTLVKLNGDYLDTRIRNTENELENYEKDLNGYLDRVLDEFGLIVCGWSAEWDTALCSAIERCPNRRFQTFWTVRGESKEKAKGLIDKRQATSVSIKDADQLFTALEEKVTSIVEYQKPHPISVKTAVATLTNYLPDEKYRIKLHNFINNEVERVLEATSAEKMPFGDYPTKESVTKRVRQYEEITKVLQHLFAVGCHWGKEEHIPIWTKALKRIADYKPVEGKSYKLFENLRRYPALLLMYSGGMAAIANGKYKTVISMLSLDGIRLDRNTYCRLLEVIRPISVIDSDTKKLIEGKEDRHTAGSDLVYEVLLDPLKSFATHDNSFQSEYDLVFDRLEYFMGLYSPYFPSQNIWKRNSQSDEFRIFNIVDKELKEQGEDWPPLKAGLFGGSLIDLEKAIELLKDYHDKIAPKYW